MMQQYSYEISGTAADGQTWTTHGTVTIQSPAITHAMDAAMRDSFMQLTKGKAVFGQPGVGCKGPYHVSRIVIDKAGL